MFVLDHTDRLGVFSPLKEGMWQDRALFSRLPRSLEGQAMVLVQRELPGPADPEPRVWHGAPFLKNILEAFPVLGPGGVDPAEAGTPARRLGGGCVARRPELC